MNIETPAASPVTTTAPAAPAAGEPVAAQAAQSTPPSAPKTAEEKFYPKKEAAAAAPAEGEPAKAPEAATPPAAPDAKPEAPKADAPKEGDPKEPADATKDGDKPAEDGSKEAEKVPVKYDLKLPEKSLLPPEHLAGIEEFAKTNNLSPESAQQMVQREHNLVNALITAQQEQAQADAQAWHEAVAKDPQLGGENFKATAFYAQKGMQIHGTQALESILNETGYGNHPEVVRLLAKLGRASAPDSFEQSGALPVEKKSMEERWYGGGTKT